jgi:hypothetical protein
MYQSKPCNDFVLVKMMFAFYRNFRSYYYSLGEARENILSLGRKAGGMSKWVRVTHYLVTSRLFRSFWIQIDIFDTLSLKSPIVPFLCAFL